MNVTNHIFIFIPNKHEQLNKAGYTINNTAIDNVRSHPLVAHHLDLSPLQSLFLLHRRVQFIRKGIPKGVIVFLRQ